MNRRSILGLIAAAPFAPCLGATPADALEMEPDPTSSLLRAAGLCVGDEFTVEGWPGRYVVTAASTNEISATLLSRLLLPEV